MGKNIGKLAEFGEEYLITEMDKLYYQIKKTFEACKKNMSSENFNEAVRTVVKYKTLRKKAIECETLYSEPLLEDNDYKIKELIKPYESINNSLRLN